MEKQKICIIGDGLSGLTSAIALNNLKNVEIHLISRKSKNITDKRTTAISESNLNFHSTSLDKRWDGTVNGTPVQQDTYVWRIKYKLANLSGLNEKTGHVNLIR